MSFKILRKNLSLLNLGDFPNTSLSLLDLQDSVPCFSFSSEWKLLYFWDKYAFLRVQLFPWWEHQSITSQNTSPQKKPRQAVECGEAKRKRASNWEPRRAFVSFGRMVTAVLLLLLLLAGLGQFLSLDTGNCCCWCYCCYFCSSCCWWPSLMFGRSRFHHGVTTAPTAGQHLKVDKKRRKGGQACRRKTEESRFSLSCFHTPTPGSRKPLLLQCAWEKVHTKKWTDCSRWISHDKEQRKGFSK